MKKSLEKRKKAIRQGQVGSTALSCPGPTQEVHIQQMGGRSLALGRMRRWEKLQRFLTRFYTHGLDLLFSGGISDLFGIRSRFHLRSRLIRSLREFVALQTSSSRVFLLHVLRKDIREDKANVLLKLTQTVTVVATGRYGNDEPLTAPLGQWLGLHYGH